MAIARPRKLTNEEKRELLSLEKDDITLDLIRNYFAGHLGQDTPRFNTYDTFLLPAKTLYNNEDIETTIGRYIVNLVVFPEKYLKKFGYVNKPLTKKAIGGIEDELGKMLLNNELTTKEYGKYLDAGEWLGMGSAYFLAPTMNYDINASIPEVTKLRDDLFTKYADGIRRGDPNTADKIEGEVLALAKKKVIEKGNEAYDFFEAGIGDFGNNYKKVSIMGGAMENPYTHKLDILKSNYIDGISKEDFPKFANLTLVGGYSRGVETQKSGYETKKFNNAMQGITLGEPGSDCGTKFYEELILKKEFANMFLNRYILDPTASDADKTNGLVLLNENNINKYIEKKIKLRSPLYCKSEKICNKCAGELFFKMGIKNPGLLSSTLSGVLMNLI